MIGLSCMVDEQTPPGHKPPGHNRPRTKPPLGQNPPRSVGRKLVYPFKTPLGQNPKHINII